jgi:parallel beta-helix repeat protein
MSARVERKNRVLTTVVILSLFTSLVGSSFVYSVGAQSQWEQFFGPLLPVAVIYDNGTISPVVLPIEREGSNYYLTGDVINYSIQIFCDNIVFDGRNHTVSSSGLSGEAFSIFAHNVVIKNLVIDSVPVAVSLYGASGIVGEKMQIKIFNNTIRNCNTAINCWGPSGNSFIANVLENNKIAIKIKGEAFSGYACFNSVEKNIIRYNEEGLHIEDANQSSVRLNLIEQNQYGATLNDVAGSNFERNEFNANTCGVHIIAPSSDNHFYQNNFDGNSETVTLQVKTVIIMGKSVVLNGLNETQNSWDNGVVGNYWSNYSGSGVYKIDENNIDHYPQTQPIDIHAQPLEPLTILVLVVTFVVGVTGTVVSLLLYRRHRKTVQQNQ